jgi:mRNA-degrading endonuclease RelE of RelBE toxin-antitoxin system
MINVKQSLMRDLDQLDQNNMDLFESKFRLLQDYVDQLVEHKKKALTKDRQITNEIMAGLRFN